MAGWLWDRDDKMMTCAFTQYWHAEMRNDMQLLEEKGHFWA